MSSLATRRLIDAAAKLEPADRALFDLWIYRGLDDERLTGLTGLSIEALQARREKIVDHLSVQLGVPEGDIRGALQQIPPDGEAEVTPRPGGEPAPQVAPTPADGPRRRRGWWLGLAGGVVIVAVVIVIVSGSGSSSSPSRAAATSVPRTAEGSTTAAATHRAGGVVPAPFTALPGGLTHASGRVALSAPASHLKLDLTVRGLPNAQAGHYEVWLYNSVLDSTPLARLRNGQDRLTAALPAGARRYRWIDISFQPLGAVSPSGESELRASNPAYASGG